MVIFSLLIHFAAAATPPPPPLKLPEEGITIGRSDYCLRSGLRIIHHSEPQHSSVTFTSVIGSGSTADPAGREGLAHVLEHLWFRSAPTGQPVWDAAASFGASLNGTTRPDDTTYPTVAPMEAFEQVLQLEVARLVNPLFSVTDEVFQTEVDVVRSEARWRYENNVNAGYLAVLEHVFPEGHPYHRPPIGYAESLNRLTLEDARAFAAEHYTPSNTTWIVTSPLSNESFLKHLEKLPDAVAAGNFAQCPIRQYDPVPLPEQPKKAPAPTRIEARVQAPVAMLAWSLPGGFNPLDSRVERVVNMLSTGLRNSGASGCYVTKNVLANMVLCTVPLQPGLTETQRHAAVRKLLNRVSDLWNDASSPTQKRRFSNERNDQLSSLFASIEFASTEHTDARWIHHTGNLDWLGASLDATMNARHVDDFRFAEKWLNQRRAVVLYLEPRGDVEGLPAGRHGGARNAPHASAGPLEASAIEAVSTVLDTSGIVDRTLDNGLRVIVFPYGQSQFTRATLMMEGGSAYAPTDSVNDLRNWYVKSTSGVVQSLKFSHAPLTFGGYWFTKRTGTTYEYGIRGVSQKLEAQLYLLRERVNRTEVNISFKSDLPAFLSDRTWAQRKQAYVWANIERDMHLQGEHSYWDPATLHEVARTKTGDVQRWNKRIVRPTGATLLIVGNVDPDNAMQLAESWFGDWKDRSDKTPHKRPEVKHQPPARKVVVFHDPTRYGVSVQLSCLMGTNALERRASRDVGTDLVKGRAHDELRGRQGVTYGVHGSRSVLADGRVALSLSTDVSEGAAGLAVSTLLAELENIAEGKITEGEIDAIKLQKALASGRDLRSSASVSNLLKSSIRSEQTFEQMAGWPKRLAAVNAASLSDVFSECAGQEIVTLLGDAESIRFSLAEVGIEATVMDWRATRDRDMQTYAPKRYKKELRERQKSP